MFKNTNSIFLIWLELSFFASFMTQLKTERKNIWVKRQTKRHLKQLKNYMKVLSVL